MLNVRKIIDLKFDICNLRVGKKNFVNLILYIKCKKNKLFFLIYNFINLWCLKINVKNYLEEVFDI